MNMYNKVRGYLEAICSAYIMVMIGVLPLYMKDGLVMIGDAKFEMFFNNSVLFLAISVLGGILLMLTKEEKKSRFISWSKLDCAMILYGGATLLSFAMSSYKNIALWGDPDWHMGCITQLLLVWGYFFVSRFCSGEKFLWQIGSVAAVVVFLIGVINRMGYDPLRVFVNINYWDWNRLNLLSTIGNINWYCGYVCVAIPLLLYCYWSAEGIGRLLGGIGSTIGLLTLFTQGSQSGYLGLFGCMAVLFWVSLRDRKWMISFLRVAGLIPIVVLFIRIVIMPWKLWLPNDDMIQVILWDGWICMAFLLIGILLLLTWRERKGCEDVLSSGKMQRIILLVVCILLVVGIVVFVLCQCSEKIWQMLGGSAILRVDADWGTGRGALWRAAVQCFVEGDWKQKLFGAGPDCYAQVAYSMTNLAQEMVVTGQWQDTVFANAHNEWLNMLVTEGILGATAYLAIFLSAFRRFLVKSKQNTFLIAGAMTIACYMLNNTLSFQQSIATPVMFVFLGMWEQGCRLLPVEKKPEK